MTAKASPGDLDILLIMDEDFEAARMPAAAQAVLDSSQTEAAVIQTDEQMLLAQQCIDNLRRVLLAARRVHAAAD